MIVISDTSVITNLIQLDQLILLRKLFGDIVLPQKVFDELSRLPKQAIILRRLKWVEVKSASNTKYFEKLCKILDAGEAEAIALAIELKADVLLIDERKGRRIAQENGILITGLLGVLLEAKTQNLLPQIKPILDKLVFEIGFRISTELYREILKKVNE